MHTWNLKEHTGLWHERYEVGILHGQFYLVPHRFQN